MRTKPGKPEAVTATAHKLARIIYTMLKNPTEYVDPDKVQPRTGASTRHQEPEAQDTKNLPFPTKPMSDPLDQHCVSWETHSSSGNPSSDVETIPMKVRRSKNVISQAE